MLRVDKLRETESRIEATMAGMGRLHFLFGMMGSFEVRKSVLWLGCKRPQRYKC